MDERVDDDGRPSPGAVDREPGDRPLSRRADAGPLRTAGPGTAPRAPARAAPLSLRSSRRRRGARQAMTSCCAGQPCPRSVSSGGFAPKSPRSPRASRTSSRRRRRFARTALSSAMTRTSSKKRSTGSPSSAAAAQRSLDVPAPAALVDLGAEPAHLAGEVDLGLFAQEARKFTCAAASWERPASRSLRE